MTYLKYYQEETQMFKPQSEIQLNNLEIKYIFNKFKKRYKLDHYLEIRGNENRGNCGRWRLRVSHKPTLGVLLHEIGHAIQYKKRGWSPEKLKQRWHGKQHRTIVKRLYRITNPKIELIKITSLEITLSCVARKDNEQDNEDAINYGVIKKLLAIWEAEKCLSFLGHFLAFSFLSP